MRILFCSWRALANPLAGGSEVLIDHLASGLSRRGHDVTLLCGGEVGTPEYRAVQAGGPYSQYLRVPATYLRAFRDADLVVDVANGIPFFAPLWRRGPSVCLVNHVHTDQWRTWFAGPMATVGRTLESRLMPLAYRNRLFVAVSPSTAGALERLGVARTRIRIVHNGVDTPDSVLTKSATPLFLALGRLVPHKRIDLLLRTWERVRPRTGGRLVIAGSGPEHERLRALAGPGVELLGQITEEEKARLLAQAWLLLHPSMLEGWGLVVMEAAASGTPTIGFDVPGVRDSVVDGVSGALVRSEAELARRWIELAQSPAQRAALATGARAVARRYSWAATVDAFDDVADEAVGRTRRVAPVPLLRRAPATTAAAARPDLSVVVPAYNETSRLDRSIPALVDLASRLNAEVIVVDDGSEDETRRMAASLLPHGAGVVLDLGRHRGKGAAVRAGVARARGRSILFMDADLATDLSHVAEAVDGLREHHIVVGSRAAPGAHTVGTTAARARMGRTFNRLARSATGLAVADFQCGFKAFRAPVAKLLFHLSEVEGFAFDVEILMLANQIGYEIAELPVHWEAVPGSHVRPARDAPAMALDVVRSRVRWTRQRTLASIQATCDSRDAAAEAVHALEPHLRGFDSVVPWHHGALGLLPFLGRDEADEVAFRIQDELPDFVVQSSALRAGALLSPSAAELRHALAAA